MLGSQTIPGFAFSRNGWLTFASTVELPGLQRATFGSIFDRIFLAGIAGRGRHLNQGGEGTILKGAENPETDNKSKPSGEHSFFLLAELFSTEQGGY